MHWKLETLMHRKHTTAQIEGKWVPARPINWKHRSLQEKIRQSWDVFTGKADSFLWPEGQ